MCLYDVFKCESDYHLTYTKAPMNVMAFCDTVIVLSVVICSFSARF